MEHMANTVDLAVSETHRTDSSRRLEETEVMDLQLALGRLTRDDLRMPLLASGETTL